MVGDTLAAYHRQTINRIALARYAAEQPCAFGYLDSGGLKVSLRPVLFGHPGGRNFFRSSCRYVFSRFVLFQSLDGSGLSTYVHVREARSLPARGGVAGRAWRRQDQPASVCGARGFYLKVGELRSRI